MSVIEGKKIRKSDSTNLNELYPSIYLFLKNSMLLCSLGLHIPGRGGGG